MKTMSNKTAWVISGGGAGIVHAFRSIEKHLAEGNPWPDFIVGTSAGGLLAMLLSHKGIDGARHELKQIRKRSDVFSSHFNFNAGLWSHAPLQRIIKRVTSSSRPFIPYYVCSQNLTTLKKVYFDFSSGWHLLSSTACIPLLVQSVWDEDKINIYSDGGAIENHPLSFAIDHDATRIHLFHCFAKGEPAIKTPKNLLQTGVRIFEGMRQEIAINDVKLCNHMNEHGKPYIDVTEHYPEKNLLGVLDFHKIRYFI